MTRMDLRLAAGGLAVLLTAAWLAAPAGAQEKPETKAAGMGDPAGAKRLIKDADVWIDPQRKLVIVDGVVCLREGQLEMFACPKGTKEHESIVAVNSKAFVLHAALLSVGAETGKPVQFDPDYQPASGTKVNIKILWIDADGKKHTARAQEWVRNTADNKEMNYDWVFAGSGFWKDEATGENHYQAEAGDLICVSNFSSAMLDLPIESTQANQGLLFEAFTERIPPLDTKVRVVLEPVIEAEK